MKETGYMGAQVDTLGGYPGNAMLKNKNEKGPSTRSSAVN